jgi:hypothetical protein
VAQNSDWDVLHVQVLPEPTDDVESLDESTSLLREELLEYDVLGVDRLTAAEAAEDSKGVVASVGGWLAVHLGPAGLKAVVNAVASWTGRTGKTVELTIGGNTLKLTGVSSDVQSRIVDEFFARQPPSPQQQAPPSASAES